MKRWFVALLVLFTLALPQAAWAQRVHGVTMPPDARKIDDEHFRASKDYKKTFRYFSRMFAQSKGLVWRPIRGNPKVKGVHIINQRRGRSWDAINIYENRNKVYIYVLKAESTAKKTKKTRKKR